MADCAETLTYTGIGSRQTPRAVLDKMRKIAARLAARGYTLRSGAADGADSAFEVGARERKEVYLPWKGFGGSASTLFDLETSHEARAIAATLHPAWERLTEPVRRLHSRNVFQVLGADLKSPSRFVICWTADGAETEAERTSRTGGTGTAIALAARNGVPVFNLARADAMERLATAVLSGSITGEASAIHPAELSAEDAAGKWRFHRDRTIPEDGSVWVFGSNLRGRHGKGSAEVAKNRFGAQRGIGRGPTGSAYAIPTKNAQLKALSLVEIESGVREFITHARANPGAKHFVTRIGCELAGHRDSDVAPLFADAPANCSFALEWKPFLLSDKSGVEFLQPLL